MSLVTCRTEACPSAGQPVRIDMFVTEEATGETWPVDMAACGACSQPITDIVDDPEQPPQPADPSAEPTPDGGGDSE